MPAWGPIGRRKLVATLKRLGFTGPFSGGRRQFMVRSDTVVTIPNLHGGDVGVGLLAVGLKQAGGCNPPSAGGRSAT